MIFSDFLSTPIQNRNILLALRIWNCGIGWDDMSFLGTKVQLRLVESVMDNQSPIISQSGSQVLVGLRNLSSLYRYLTFDHDQISTKLCIHDLLPTSDPLAMRNLSILSLHCYLPSHRDRYDLILNFSDNRFQNCRLWDLKGFIPKVTRPSAFHGFQRNFYTLWTYIGLTITVTYPTIYHKISIWPEEFSMWREYGSCTPLCFVQWSTLYTI